MKKLITALCVVTILACSVSASRATDDSAAAAADAIVVRPLSLVAVVIGSGLFVLSLPFTAPSGNIGKSAHLLIGKPAKATFQRPLGDFESLQY